MGHLAGVGTVSALNAVGVDGSSGGSGNSKLTSFFDKEQNNVVILAKQWGSDLVQNAPIAGEVAWRSAREMTRPMRVFGSESMTRHEKRERKEAWMHAARM